MTAGIPRRDHTWAAGTFLGSLRPEVAEALVRSSVQRTLEAGRTVLREGSRDTHVLLLIDGFVKVTTSVEGVETLLGIRLPGEVVGEIGALTGEPRNATVIACGPLTVGQLSRGDFSAFLRQRSDAAALIAAAMTRQLRWANRRRVDFAAFPAHVRLARLLTEIAEVCGRQRPDGSVELLVALSQTDLAAMIAIAPATIQKALQQLRDRGLITTGYRRLVVTDLAKLRAAD
ncbi:Crp/Fnr family transcriptional regulator [Actinoplanes sichuanensis]|uniref:Crp/Fnr family transcriptional regulator n=1 Tax=Actinoplanes sichuanensis TaxID=512349 RepID=A0ABW4AMY0_9ACTN|nr:Crp/Fnr family transcriptional regulator [Actinoplanes sichuanensis]BEL08450.1 Crp/Fnr family transcriptional regulator [Actinoplanes sichuanensis]